MRRYYALAGAITLPVNVVKFPFSESYCLLLLTVISSRPLTTPPTILSARPAVCVPANSGERASEGD